MESGPGRPPYAGLFLVTVATPMFQILLPESDRLMNDESKTTEMLIAEPDQRESVTITEEEDVRLAPEELLRRSEEQFRAIFEGSQDVLLVVDGEEGRILKANRALVGITGHEVEEIVGRPFSALCPTSQVGGREDSLDDLQTFGPVIAAQSCMRRDGSVIPVDLTAAPLRWGDETTFLVTLRNVSERVEAERALQEAHDLLEQRVEERTRELAGMNRQLRQEVTERTRAEQAAQESEERFRAVFETARDCIFIKDPQLRYVLVNPSMEQLLDRSAAQIVGYSDTELFGKEAGDHLREVEARVLKGEAIEEEHTRLVKGGPVTFLDVRAPMRDKDGIIAGLCGISHDITDRQRVERRPAGAASRVPASRFASPVMRQTVQLALSAAKSDSVMLFLGESGAGKDYLAQLVHAHSRRATSPFFTVNCAAVVPELAESELFGHEPGAFTGSRGRVRGLLELAEGGTLLLNEIGELQPHVQAKLLTFLDTRTITRVGGRSAISVNARIMAATNRDLEEEVAAGRFRADLFYRLDVISIRVPPLRQRIEDLPLLIDEILAELAVQLHVTPVPRPTAEILRRFQAYSWPGNIRELRNMLEQSLILSQGQRIDLAPCVIVDQGEEWRHEVRFPQHQTLDDLTRDVKRAVIEEALRRAAGSRKEASRLLGITRHALRRQMESAGLMRQSDT